MYDMKYLVGQYGVTCSVHPSLQVRHFTTPHLHDLRGLLVTLAAIVIIINRGLFLHSFPNQVLSVLERALSVKYTANFRKMQLLRRT